MFSVKFSAHYFLIFLFLILTFPLHANEPWTPTRGLNSDAFIDNSLDYNLDIGSGNGILVASWCTRVDNVQKAIKVSRSIDGGHIWSPAITLVQLERDKVVPKVVFVQAGQWSICDFTNGTIYTSGDDGKTWSSPSDIQSPVSLADLHPYAIDTNEAGVLLLVAQGPQIIPSRIVKSLDGGKTWDFVGQLPGHAKIVESIVHTGDLRWALFAWEEREVFLTSNDGSSWTSAGLPPFINNGYYYLEETDSDHHGTIVASTVYVNFDVQIPQVEIFAATSKDHGQTWSQPIRIHGHPRESDAPGSYQRFQQAFTIHVNRDQWKIFSLDSMNLSSFGDPSVDNVSNLVMCTSYDGGLTWNDDGLISADVGTWFGNQSAIKNVFTAVDGNIVTGWQSYNISIDKRDIGRDGDLVYRVLEYALPTAAKNWTCYE